MLADASDHKSVCFGSAVCSLADMDLQITNQSRAALKVDLSRCNIRQEFFVVDLETNPVFLEDTLPLERIAPQNGGYYLNFGVLNHSWLKFLGCYDIG